MSRTEPMTVAELRARYAESAARLGLPQTSMQTPRARLVPLLRPLVPTAPADERTLGPREIEALADALMRRMQNDAPDVVGLPRPLMLADIVAAVARRHGFSLSELRSERRSAPVVKARQQAAWLCRKMTLRSLPKIGEAIRRDHTTVIYSLRVVEAELARNPSLGTELAAVEAELRARFEPSIQHPDGAPGTGGAS